MGSWAINTVCKLTYKLTYKTSNNVHIQLFKLLQVLLKVNTIGSEPISSYTNNKIVPTETIHQRHVRWMSTTMHGRARKPFLGRSNGEITHLPKEKHTKVEYMHFSQSVLVFSSVMHYFLWKYKEIQSFSRIQIILCKFCILETAWWWDNSGN